jgi:hypothetical protein
MALRHVSFVLYFKYMFFKEVRTLDSKKDRVFYCSEIFSVHTKPKDMEWSMNSKYGPGKGNT